jgi:hypothetical protein
MLTYFLNTGPPFVRQFIEDYNMMQKARHPPELLIVDWLIADRASMAPEEKRWRNNQDTI